VKEIPLTGGKIAIVDDEDHAYVSRWSWFAVRGKHTFYAVRTVNVSKTRKYRVAMHRQLEGAPENVMVDHINGDGLDNRRANLRLCMAMENARNSAARGGSSRFKGVGFHRVTGKWAAYIRVDGRQMHLGLYRTEDAAARAYDEAARTHYGAFARLNFPEVRHAV
jgi:hypothetical protein